MKSNQAQQHSNPNAVVGLEGIMPASPYDPNKRRQSLTADIERAQKFRERAKTIAVIGKPEFRSSKKYQGKDIYKTLGSHPDLLELTGGPRRVSDDRTSNCNSVPDDYYDNLEQIESGRNSSGPASGNNSARNTIVAGASSSIMANDFNSPCSSNELYQNISQNLGPKFEKLVASSKSHDGGIAFQKQYPAELSANSTEV